MQISLSVLVMTTPSIKSGPSFSPDNVSPSIGHSKSQSQSESPSTPDSPYTIQQEHDFRERQGLPRSMWRPQRNSKQPDRLVNALGSPKANESVSPWEYHYALFAPLSSDGRRIRDDEPVQDDDSDSGCWGCAQLEAKLAAMNEK